MDYYTASDVKEITGLGTTASYELIAKLNEELKKEYPDSITLTAKIPKWYFEEKLKNKKGE